MTEERHARGRVAAGDLTQRVGVEAIETRGVNVEELVEKLIDAAGAEFTTYYYYTHIPQVTPRSNTIFGKQQKGLRNTSLGGLLDLYGKYRGPLKAVGEGQT